MPNLTGPTAIVIVLIVLLLFGAPKLPALARSLGQSMKILKKEVTTNTDESTEAETTQAPAAGSAPSVEEDLAAARAEAAAAKAEADALRAAAEKRTSEEKSAD